MPIKSNAAPSELSSPFYQQNKELCEQWEHFIKERNGKINAIYNAWSLDIKTKFTTPNMWLVSIRKGTYSNGSLLFSAKSQNLLEIMELQTRIKNTNCRTFYISRSIFKNRRAKHPLYTEAVSLFSGKRFDFVKFDGEILTFRYSHRNNDFDLVKRVIRQIDSLY
ncbi:MAG: hypothetical protein NXI10_02840 [bacterium]|nr:hypothetical protein [bacterium]